MLYYLFSIECVGEVLFVGEDEEGHLLQVVFGEQLLERLGAFGEAAVVGGVHHVDEPIRVLVVVLPVGSDCLLTTDVPHVQLEALLGL